MLYLTVQARQDLALVTSTAGLLLETLRSCPPLSLREPAECLAGLEDLLCCWLQEAGPDTSHHQIQTTAAALVR